MKVFSGANKIVLWASVIFTFNSKDHQYINNEYIEEVLVQRDTTDSR